MIEVKSLTKKYGDRLAVNNISFSVQKGEVLGFLGQNGAGKSTTMKVLTCFTSATSGTASVAGFDVFDNPYEVKKRVGYLPESPPLYMELLVGEYLNFVADLKGIPSKDKKKRIDVALQKCQLTDVRKRLIGNLSKGYKQRVGIAQAILHEPDVLILDEPTIGLDPKQVSEARSLIRGLGREHTVIYSTHILSEVAATCDRIIVIDRGEIVAQESLAKLRGTEGTTAFTEIVLQTRSESVVTSLRAIKGVKDVKTFFNGTNKIVVESESRDEILAEMARVVVAGAGLVKMSPVQLMLEDYYLNLIGAKRSDQ